ncbi:MAG: hypothetical protein A2X36_04225 [Elusimicrobia bacterium GWA2_69_24]|nr:MAG: hypothetical protein A2X36_04225 [Elusimicrobia bacterium GWA2_69_24]HBL16146.1 hypothetical protein [Elusimicrobiota bacterium]
MKVALLAGSTYSDATTHSVFTGLRSAYERAGHEAWVVSRPGSGDGLAFPPESAERLLILDAPPLRLPVQLWGILRRRRIEVVHLHFSGWFRSWHLGLLPLTRLSSCRWVVTFQDFGHPELPPNDGWRAAALGLLLDRAGAVTAVSDFLKARITRSLPGLDGRIRTVYNGVPDPGGPGPAGTGPSGRPYILSVGRLAPYKGTDLLLMAFAKLERPDLDLILCGAPFHGSHIAGLIHALGLRDRVRLTGLRPQAEVRALMKGCLFYAAAPRAETFGMAAAEALSCGKAVVATRTGAIPELVTDGVNGLLAEPKDVDSLAAKLRLLAGDPLLRRSLEKRAAESAERFRWERIAEEYLRVY